MTRLPPINPAKSVHDWEQWYRTPARAQIPKKVYEQHKPRAEKVVIPVKKVKRK